MSTENALLTTERLSALRQRVTREEQRVALVEGTRFVIRALEAGREILGVGMVPGYSSSTAGRKLSRELARRGVPRRVLSPADFRAISLADEPQGIAAVVRQSWSQLPLGAKRSRDLWVAVEHVRSPGNLGSVLRTAEAAGARGAIFLGPDADPHDPRCLRGSMGSIFGLELVRASHQDVARWGRRARARIVGTSARADRDYRNLSYRGPLVLMLGCERGGMSLEQEALCDKVVRIPLRGNVDSLNIAVAAGVMLYAAFAERNPMPRRG